MNVTIFSTTNCAVCHAEMQWLESKAITYKNIVIDEVDDGIEQFMSATGGAFQATPFTVIETNDGKETISGFDRKKLQVLLHL
jgi:arsenate reductase-like glutaredoxin family protein